MIESKRAMLCRSCGGEVEWGNDPGSLMCCDDTLWYVRYRFTIKR